MRSLSPRGCVLLVALVASLLLVSLCVAGCPAPSDNPERFEEAVGAPVFTKEDHNISVAKGQTFIVRLDSNPTTGYTWMLRGDAAPEGLELLGCKYTSVDVISPRTPGPLAA
jgi:hypothetical protein